MCCVCGVLFFYVLLLFFSSSQLKCITLYSIYLGILCKSKVSLVEDLDLYLNPLSDYISNYIYFQKCMSL